jgi:hypothetical protein
VEIFKDDHELMSGSQLTDNMRHRLEDPRAILESARGRDRSVCDLGKQPREITAHGGD